MEKLATGFFPWNLVSVSVMVSARKYRPIWVSVLVSDLNQNSGFGRTLMYLPFIWFTLSSHSQKYQMTDFKWPLFTNSFHLVFEFFQFSSLKFGLMIFIPIVQKIKILFNFIWRARVSEWMSCKQFAIIIFAVKSLSLGKIITYSHCYFTRLNLRKMGPF